MPNNVYRAFTSEDLFSTTIQTEPTVVVWSGSAGYGGNTNYGSASLSLYGGVRSRSDVGPTGSAGVRIYPLVDVETYTIDGVIQVPDPYPHTASIRFFRCYNMPQDASVGRVASDEMWYEEHHSVVRRTSDWYNTHIKSTYAASSSFPDFFTGMHVPEIFYHRQIATGSIQLTVSSFIGAPAPEYPTSSSLYWIDDGYGRLWSVPSFDTPWNLGTQVSGVVLYNEGIIAFTHPDPVWHNRLASGTYSVPFEPHIQLQFRSVNPIKSMVFQCRMAPGDVNASNNLTYWVTGTDGKRWAWDKDTNTEAVTYISAIGLYNEERQLVAVAKIAQPIRKRERDAVDIRLRLDV